MLTSLGRGPRGEPTLQQLLLDCHSRIRHFLALAERIAADKQAPHREIVEACDAVSDYFSRALPLHVRDEEESVLPRLSGYSPSVDAALQAMHVQHQQHEHALAMFLAALLWVRQAPERTRVELHETTAVLKRDFAEHLALEESTILPALTQLSGETQAEIIRELRARRA